MKLDIQNNRIDPNSNFAWAFRRSARRAYSEVFGDAQYWYGERSQFKKMRKIIDRDMVDYLLDNNGVVDGWPDPCTDLSVTYTWSEGREKNTATRYFHYFSNEEMGEIFSLNSQTRGIKFHNEYEYEHTELYKKTIENGEYVGVTPGENRITILKYWGARLPMIWAVMAAVIAVLVFLTRGYTGGMVPLIESISDGTFQEELPMIADMLLGPLVWLLGLPAVFAMFVDMLLVENLGLIGLLIGCAVLLGGGYGGYRWLIFKWDNPSPLNQKELKRKVREKKAIRDSAEYKRIVKEEQEKCSMCWDLSNDWHTAWFEQYKREHPHRDYYRHNN